MRNGECGMRNGECGMAALRRRSAAFLELFADSCQTVADLRQPSQLSLVQFEVGDQRQVVGGDSREAATRRMGVAHPQAAPIVNPVQRP